MEVKFKLYGEEKTVRFIKTAYAIDGSLAILAESLDEYGWEPYGPLTVNIGVTPTPNSAFLDTNNCGMLCGFVMEQGWAEEIGEGCSGFCTYPLVEFTEEFINEICEVAA